MAPKKGSAQSKKKDKGKKSQSPTPQKSTGHPDDIFPLVLTSATQELFSCRADEDVTAESPYKLLKKNDIIKDIKTRAAVSDFSPVKQIVLDYPEDEILLVFDRSFTYGHSFYLVLTPAAKDRILRPPEPEIPEETEINKKKREPKPWISLGSEKEINEESVKETREKELQYRVQFQGKCRDRVSFSDCNTADSEHGFLECPSYQDNSFTIKLVKRDCGIQASSWLQSNSTQTQWMCRKNAFTEYRPRSLCKEDVENILQSESLKNFCQLVTPRILYALQQNAIGDVFFDEWKALGTGAEVGEWSGQICLVLHQAFADNKYTKGKKISCANWHPTIYGVIAVALIDSREKQLISAPSFIVFFSFSNSSQPQLVLECPDDVFAFEFCPSNPNIIVGGCRNGQVALWDISNHSTYLEETQSGSKTDTDTFDFDRTENKIRAMLFSAASALESSHKSPVTDVYWMPPSFEVTKTGVPIENELSISVQVVTCSPDCTVMFWDVRRPESLNQPLPGKLDNEDGILPITIYSVSKTFKHLSGSWEPLFKISPPAIDNSGVYVPLKFSLKHYTCDTEKKHTENFPDYSELRVSSAKTSKTLEDVDTKFYFGTEDGQVVYTDWKLTKDKSKRLCSAESLHCFRAHSWLVNTMERSPFFPDIILTTGGWNFAIWKEGVTDGPLVLSQNFEFECTTGCWSVSRPAVFFIGKEDGSIEVWTLLRECSGPLHIQARITTGRITCMKPWTASSRKRYLAATDDLGVVRIFDIPRIIYVPSKNENLQMKKYFELEEEWLKDCLKREELWATQKKTVEERNTEKEPNTPAKVKQDNTEVEMKQYDEDLMLEESVLKAMGLLQHS